MFPLPIQSLLVSLLVFISCGFVVIQWPETRDNVMLNVAGLISYCYSFIYIMAGYMYWMRKNNYD